MNPLREYAEHWLTSTAVRLNNPRDHRLNTDWISDIEGGRPGFSAQLRQVALDALNSDDRVWTQKGIAALAVVGQVEDLVALAACRSRAGSDVASSARTAMFEIEHRAPAS